MIYFATFSTTDCFVRHEAIYGSLISPWILMKKYFKVLRAREFLKYFRYINVFCANYGQEFQIRAQLMTNTTYSRRDPTRLYYGFGGKLMVLISDQLFSLEFYGLLAFCFHFLYSLRRNDLVSPIRDPVSFKKILETFLVVV